MSKKNNNVRITHGKGIIKKIYYISILLKVFIITIFKKSQKENIQTENKLQF